MADTPTLAGIRTRTPFLHDGRADTLRDVLTTHNPTDSHGRTSDLSEADLSALLLHLETL
jgi:cytochrome c peroxidase